jgi:hypothetical protein
VIKLSTPTQVPNSAGNTPETSQGSSVFGQKVRKKNGFGLFAKLFDGLVNKSRKGSAGFTGQINQTHTGEEGVSSGKTGKSLSLSKKVSLPGDESGESVLNPGEIQTLLGQNSLESLEIRASEAAEETGSPARLSAKGSGEAGQVSHGAAVFWNREGRGGEGGIQQEGDPGGAFPAVDGEDHHGLSEFVKESSRTVKESRGAVDLLWSSARNLESGVRQFTGDPRPGLVDMLGAEKPGESGRETKSPGVRKGRDRITVDVRDLRVEKTPAATEGGSPEKTAPAASKVDAAIPVELRVSSAREQGAGEGFMNRSAFEDALAQQLHENLGSDIVKQASIILRDSGEGTIRLSLKPETLGNVKIRLEMTENKITGHIVVESSEAFKAFERELPVLEKQFQESGFSETNLEMSFSQDNGGSAQYRQEEGEPLFSPFLAASRYDAETERAELLPQRSSAISTGRTAVNLLV